MRANASVSVRHRAFLKWAGGKYRLLDDILAQFPKKSCLVEPFVGAGSVFLNSRFERYLLADINPDLISLFNLIKRDVAEYRQHAKALFQHPQANSKTFYLEQRRIFNQSADPFERAVIFLYLNRHGFNGLCRYNRKHLFNVPFGDYRQPYFPEKELEYFAEKAQRATFVCMDFDQLLSAMLPEGNDFVVYCDPPYAPISQVSNFTHYAGGGFNLAQQKRLAEWAEILQRRQIPVLISNHDTPFTREIYQRAQLTTLQVQRSISQKGSKRLKVSELLANFS